MITVVDKRCDKEINISTLSHIPHKGDTFLYSAESTTINLRLYVFDNVLLTIEDNPHLYYLLTIKIVVKWHVEAMMKTSV